MRKVKILSVSNDLLLEVFRNSLGQVKLNKFVSNLPEDTKAISCHANYERNCIDFLIESNEFEVVEDCCLPPMLEYETTGVNKSFKDWMF